MKRKGRESIGCPDVKHKGNGSSGCCEAEDTVRDCDDLRCRCLRRLLKFHVSPQKSASVN